MKKQAAAAAAAAAASAAAQAAKLAEETLAEAERLGATTPTLSKVRKHSHAHDALHMLHTRRAQP
jgi:opacity protein-like surface antigen